MTRQIRKPGSNGSKQPNNKRNFVSKTNTGCRTNYRTSPKLCLTDSEVKISAGDSLTSPPLPYRSDSDAPYWGDDELEPSQSDFEILAPSGQASGGYADEYGLTYCAHCGLVPSDAQCKYCTRCRQTKHEWLPNAPTRPLRRKLYKNSARPRHRKTKSKTGAVKTKATKIKTKLKSLVSRKCHPQPPLSKFSNLKSRRLCYLRRHSESSSSSGNSVLEEKANAFRKRRDFFFYKYHKYESDNSS
ncbi:hypothetical protein M8J77_009484 [Diaphorina citri]|nr:hypothetical protein M8J77_009484 [Diaphorina citri]